MTFSLNLPFSPYVTRKGARAEQAHFFHHTELRIGQCSKKIQICLTCPEKKMLEI